MERLIVIQNVGNYYKFCQFLRKLSDNNNAGSK